MSDKLKKLLGQLQGTSLKGSPRTIDEVRGFIAGKAGQWINQNSHIDRESAIEKAYELSKILFTEQMFEVCMAEGAFDEDVGRVYANDLFQILAWHYQFADPENLGHSVLSRDFIG